MQEQKDRSKNASKIVKGDWVVLIENEVTEFVGYDLLESEIKLQNPICLKNELLLVVFGMWTRT